MNFLTDFLKYQKTWVNAFLRLNTCRKLWISVITSSQWNMYLVSIFWVIWGKLIETREALNFRGEGGQGGLKKNTNYGFPLSKFKLFKSKIIQFYYCSYLKDRNCLRNKFFSKFAKLNPGDFFVFLLLLLLLLFFFRICRFYIFTLGFLSINEDHVKNIVSISVETT